MPHTVTYQVKATNVRRGDAVLGSDTAPVTGRLIVDRGELVTSTKRAVKNVTFETPGGNIVVSQDAMIHIRREEETPEERRVAEDAYHLDSLKRLVADWASDPTTKIREQLDKFEVGKHGEALSHWNLDQFLTEQAAYKVGVTITATAERIADQDRFAGLTEDELLVTAVAITVGGFRSYNRNPLSRSTSVTSNLFEDLDTWAQAEFMDKLRWGGLHLVERRLAELKAQADNN